MFLDASFCIQLLNDSAETEANPLKPYFRRSPGRDYRLVTVP